MNHEKRIYIIKYDGCFENNDLKENTFPNDGKVF